MNNTPYRGNVEQVTNVWFVSGVVKRLVKQFDKNGLESLSEPERVVFLTWCTHGDICNGGLRYFYEGKLPVMEVADAFQMLGFAEAAEACRGSLTFFPPEVVAQGSEKMLAWMMSLWGEAEEDDSVWGKAEEGENDPLERVTDFFRPYNIMVL